MASRAQIAAQVPRDAAAPGAKQASTRHWVILFASAVLEAVWALALKESHGFTVLAPTIVFAIANPISLFGLGYAMRGLPVSVAYAIWTGLGAALTVAASILMGLEAPSVLKLVFLAGIVGCVIGLKFAKDPAEPVAVAPR
ncbi:multidrug efflux SMR transporter [Leucobacter luti]|uniref:DMT family transporter n=1 Tax=Leucobacter luti TaxID=340320 RepID=UPI00104DD6E2|nr:multidrug efflux SMR transporter [Leucobacter luti]MCW2287436.1 quaternary ammonium compound-resistance protein SugE [Leucobacter luti]QYM76514.1 multidrug efflux SMR transporter [Leucobacter luti]TCK41659.1 quaternary ammonium compound-resistance protein SugE [Leucobacter luti]